MDYYSLFWGPGVISTINEPWDAFMCRSSTLAVLSNSDPFHGLLLTVLGPESISIVVEPQGALMCWSSTLAVLADSESFHGLLLTVLANPGVCLCVDRQHSHFWPILAHFMDYYSLFWGPGVISTINEH